MTEPLQPDPNVVLAAAETLGQRVDNLRDSLDGLKARLRIYKILITGLIVVAVFSIAGLIVSLVVAVASHHASDKATAALSKANINQQTQIATCKSSNESRAAAKQSWLHLYDTLLAQPKAPTQTQADYDRAKKLVEQLRAGIVKAYQPRDCSAAALQHSTAPK